MKNLKKYSLEGLNCANCAAKIEKGVKHLEGINSTSVNFALSILQVELQEGYEKNITSLIEETVKKYEEDVTVCEIKEKEQKKILKNKTDKAEILKLIIGGAFFVVGLILLHFFEIKSYISLFVFIGSYLILGGEILLRAFKNIIRGQVFDENFLMSIATIGAFAIGETTEAAAVMLFYQIGEYFQNAAVEKSKQSISELMDIRPDYANLKKGKETVRVNPVEVKIGDLIIVKPGEKIPLDGVIESGESLLDTRALTGEPAAKKVKVSDTAMSGCINQSGVLTIKVTKSYFESTASKILDLVENASSKKAATENFITKFSKYYTPLVVLLALFIAVLPPVFMGSNWAEWINRGLIFLVISCPCALVISIPLSFFGGIGAASKKNVLIKGGNYLEALNNVDTVVFDKTGTLTKGVFKVTDIQSENGFSKDKVLEIAATVEIFSTHPIAISIIKAYKKEIDKNIVLDYEEISGYGVSATFLGKKILAGNYKLMEKYGINYQKAKKIGTKVYVAEDGVFVGAIIISDEIKDDSKNIVSQLKSRGVKKTVILTGDSIEIAKATAEELEIDEVYGELLPDQKLKKVEELLLQKSKRGKLAFVGDGINDAPVLVRSDIGISMGGIGSDAAIEASDIVLMSDEPSKVCAAIDIAHFTKKIVIQNIVFALSIKIFFLILGAFGMAEMWEAIFADVGVTILAVLNSMRIIKARKIV